jgi:hypothetical protein
MRSHRVSSYDEEEETSSAESLTPHASQAERDAGAR